jgi:hypothetical protein
MNKPEEAEPFKVIDRRGEPKEGKLPNDPGRILKIRRTGKPREFLAIFPFNRIQEHYFTVNRIEDLGFALGLHPPENPTKKQKRALEAARRRLHILRANARALHEAEAIIAAPSQVAEPDGTQ